MDRLSLLISTVESLQQFSKRSQPPYASANVAPRADDCRNDVFVCL